MLREIIIALAISIIPLASAATESHASDAAPSVRDHRTPDQVRDHRTPHKNEVVPITRAKLDCEVGTVKLLRMGYGSVIAHDCKGPVYGYTAMTSASLFRVSMSAYTGTMDIQFVGIAAN